MQAGRLSFGVALRFALGKVETADHRHRRLISIIQGSISGLGNKLLGTMIRLVSVPLTIGYLGPERYGVWVLIGSVLAWSGLADLGIGNGLTNAIARAIGTERLDLVRTHISTALAVLSTVALGLGLLLAVAWPWIDWNGLLGIRGAVAQAEASPAIALAFAIFFLDFPFSVVGCTYNATQEGKLGNYWGAAGKIVRLLALVVVTQTHGGLVLLIICVYGTGLVMDGLSGVWLFTRHKPALAPRLRHVSKASAREVMSVGVQFFLIQILSLIVFETDNFVIAHFLGAGQVPPYSVTYSLFGFTSIIQTVAFSYVWVAYAEAIARRDIHWVRRTFMMNMAFSLGFTFTAVVPLIFIARPFIRVWAGAEIVPPSDLVLWMAGWSMINAFCSPMACLLAAASHLKAQLAYSAASCAINVVLSIYLVQRWGVTGAIAGTVIAYLLLVCLPISIDVGLLIRKLGHKT